MSKPHALYGTSPRRVCWYVYGCNLDTGHVWGGELNKHPTRKAAIAEASAGGRLAPQTEHLPFATEYVAGHVYLCRAGGEPFLYWIEREGK